MAEAEEVLTDVARHATVFARQLWHRHRAPVRGGRTIMLADIAARLSLLVNSVFGKHHVIRVAQPPAPTTLLDVAFGGRRGPICRQAVPATDDTALWLPARLDIADRDLAMKVYRTMVLQQAMRAHLAGAAGLDEAARDLERDLYLLLVAAEADRALTALLPGMAGSVDTLRAMALAARPPPSAFPAHLRPLESFVRTVLTAGWGTGKNAVPTAALRERAGQLADELYPGTGRGKRVRLLRDLWTGELIRPDSTARAQGPEGGVVGRERDATPRSGRLPRRPQVREAGEQDDDDPGAGAWMVQADEPHEKAEDPMGVQRPVDRDESPDAEHLGDLLSELPEARLVSTPGRPKEVLLSDDPPTSRVSVGAIADEHRAACFEYPEWDWRSECYRHPGASVRELQPRVGSRAWVERTLEEHRAMLLWIRRHFEALRARRSVLRRLPDGEEIDLDASIDALADLRAGAALPERLYQRVPPAQRDVAALLLIDVSGSTDGWVSTDRRIIDVEREALLLVCTALRDLGEPFAVQAFSGEGAGNVTVCPIKGFDEPFDDEIALRIAALEPELYTRAGAAIRHATAQLMRRSAGHRLLLVLSDGRPNDIDCYEGRYGVEDMRQAVQEACAQGVHPFCLTIDRQAPDYVPHVFGAHHYAMLPRSDLLPTVLLDWVRRLLSVRRP